VERMGWKIELSGFNPLAWWVNWWWR